MGGNREGALLPRLAAESDLEGVSVPFDTWQRVLDGEGAEVACEGREMIDLLVLFCGFSPTGHQP